MITSKFYNYFYTTLKENELKYKLGNVSCGIIEGNIFYIVCHSNSNISFEEIKYTFDIYEKYSINEKLRVIIKMERNSNIEPEGRKFLQTHKIEAVCEACIIENLAQRLIVSFYHKYKSHSHPSKTFRTFDQALHWASQFDESILIQTHQDQTAQNRT